MGYGKLTNVCNTRLGLRAILRLAMNYYDNAVEVVDSIYSQYPEMDDLNTEVRTKAASQMLTDFVFGSQAYSEAKHHARYQNNKGSITPRVSDGCNSFGIVCLSVCPSVHPSVSLSWPNKHSYRPDLWHIGHA